jgi:hypothetical protein
VQQDRAKRSACFEKVARDAVAALERRPAAPSAATPAAETPEPPASTAPKEGKYAAFVGKAKANVSRAFKDPSSVQFRNLFVSTSGSQALCGELNAKNSYGAYVGFRRFFATEEPALQDVEDPRAPSVMATMWGMMCGSEIERVE